MVCTRSAMWSVLAVFALILLCGTARAQEMVLTYDGAAGETPVGISIDKVGNFWVSLEGICEIRGYTPDWRPVSVIKVPGGCTGGNAVDATGRLYFAVRSPSEDVRGVYEVDNAGVPHRLQDSGQIAGANSLAFDHNNGTLYVTDMTNGRVYRIPQGRPAELWAEGPAFEGVAIPNGPPMIIGANGLAVHRGSVIVSVSFMPRIVRVPINPDGSAGTPEILAAPLVFLGNGMAALDDIALDIFGNVYASIVGSFPGGPRGVVFIPAAGAATPDGVRLAAATPSAVTTLAFGTGKGDRRTLFVGLNQQFGGTLSGILAVDAGVPGGPLP